jgi:hypothetical protein
MTHNIATDNNKIVVGGQATAIWVRNGPDDWSSLGAPTGVDGTVGQVAVSGDFVVQSASNQSVYHDGTSWALVPLSTSSGAWAQPLSESTVPSNFRTVPEMLPMSDANGNLIGMQPMEVPGTNLVYDWNRSGARQRERPSDDLVNPHTVRGRQ